MMEYKRIHTGALSLNINEKKKDRMHEYNLETNEYEGT